MGDLSQSTYTDMTNTVEVYEPTDRSPDNAQDQKENYWHNAEFPKFFGYYKEIPELKKAIDAYSTWVLGKGFTTNRYTQRVLDNIKGWGEDTFNSILWNMVVMKKVNGDAFAEIIREETTGRLINIKPISPSRMRVVVNAKGKITSYDYMDSKNQKLEHSYKPNEILHLCNDRVADEIHGTSVIEAVKWVIDARNEAMRDWRKISHRSSLRILYADVAEDKVKDLKTQYQQSKDKDELLILTVKKGDAEFMDLTLPPADQFLSWIRYLENFFYQAVGIPKVILGGSEEFTEASSKISYLTYEQIYTREVVELQADLYNQLGIRIEFNKPASLKSEMLNSEEKNTGQVGFQPNDTEVNMEGQR